MWYNAAMKTRMIVQALIAVCAIRLAASPAWPVAVRDMKPWVYNWWMGGAVDEAGLEHQCRELSAKGFGGFHVIQIYGAKGYEDKYVELMSPKFV